MAKKTVRPKKVYRLYTHCRPGREPLVSVSVPEYDIQGNEVGTTTALRPRWGGERGALIGEFTHYNRLVDHAKGLAKKIGLPASRIWDIFDWNL